MRCYICDKSDWHRPTVIVDGKERPIHSKATTQICKHCGNACHDVDVSKEDQIKDFYRNEYRPPPTVLNIITTTHKVNYVRVFLNEFLAKANADGKQLLVGDVGAATGYLLNFFRNMGHKVSGCELTKTFRSTSEHYYGIPLSEDLETKHKYDLITIYHVLEHLMEPDKKLAHYASLLAPGGHMLIATPLWFESLEENAGPPIQGFDHLFHENHINLFSRTSLNNLFRKCGLQVVKEDFVQYGQSYLLKKRESPVADGWLTKEDWHEQERIMKVQKHAMDLFLQGQFREAYEAYPNFPDAWLNYIFNRCAKDPAKQADVMEDAEKHIGSNYKYILSKAQWMYQQGRLGEAIELFQKVLQKKPNEDTLIYYGYALAQAGHKREAIQALANAAAMCPTKWQECHSWMLATASGMPTWDQRAQAELQAQLLKDHMARKQTAAEPAVG